MTYSGHYCYVATTPKLRGLKQSPFYYANGLCRPESWTGTVGMSEAADGKTQCLRLA